MKGLRLMWVAGAVVSVMTLSAAGSVWAGADDAKWVGQCIQDNKREGQSEATVAIYCACMNNQMSDNETLSISAWEKTHPKEMAKCEKEAGWK